MAPRPFGKYEVLARLATGGAANIFLARQPGAAGFHKLVCLKTLLAERASDEDFVAMFLDEARLAARLNHPNCVQIYDLGRVRGVYYISMEYIFGDTLWNLLTTVTKLKTPLPPPHVAAIIANACDGLHHAHELKDSEGKPYNLVHRDVSPQNIMITYEGQTKVVDFGIAKAETGRAPTVAGIVKGKFSYMSPEQITGGSVDRRSDIYSLGIVFFECLASRRLYRGDSPEDIARLILEHRAPRLRDVVPEVQGTLDEICAKALARHPSKRFQTALEMGDALRDYLDSVRYNQSASTLAKLLEERFGETVSKRRAVFESALAGGHDEKRLLEALEARAVRNLDLFPDGDDKPDPKEFSEQTSEHASWKDSTDPPDPDPPEVPTGPLGAGDRSSRHALSGYRLEVEAERSPPISVLAEDTLGAETMGDDTTRIDPEVGESEDATRVDPTAIEVQRPESISGLTDAPGGDSRTEDVAANEVAGSATLIELSSEGAWGEDETRADGAAEDRFDDRTPFDGFPDQTAPPKRDLGIVVTAASGPGNGAVVRRSKAAPKAAQPEQTIEEIEIPTRESQRAPSDVPEPEPHAPPAPEPPLQDLATPPVRDVSMPVRLDRRYTLAALLAAMGFGISFGLVAGLLLARVIFSE
jgi:serine/threonine protein kinase